MNTIIKELKNIPVSISILHEQEYNNLCIIYNNIRGDGIKRRAFTEKRNKKLKSGPKYSLSEISQLNF